MNITFQPVQVEIDEEGDGLLVFRDRALVALLVRLSDTHGGQTGHWFLEAGFGILSDYREAAFPDLPAAEAWIRDRLAETADDVGALGTPVGGRTAREG
jgi:hypothetical protein